MLSLIKRSLSMHAAIYVFGICLTLLGLEVWREWTARDTAISRAELETANLALSLVQHADDTFEMATGPLNVLVQHFEMDGITMPALERARSMMAVAINASSRLTALFVFDSKGNWLVTSQNSIPEHANNSDRAYFQYHRQSASISAFIGPPVISKSTGEWVITITRRFNNADGSFGGVVAATIDAKYFTDFYKGFNVGSSGSIALINTDGMLLARMPFDARAMGSDLSGSNLFTKQIKISPSGSYTYISPMDGVERIGGYQLSNHYPIMVVAAVSADEAMAAWYSSAVQRGAVTLVLVILVGALGFWLTDQIVRRQKSEVVLGQREAEFRLIAESASDLVERIDGDGMLIYASPASFRLLGVPRDELIGTSVFDNIHVDDRPFAYDAADRLRSRETSEETVTYRARHKDGHEVWLETSLRIATENDLDHNRGVVAVTRDISARKALEMQLEAMATRDGLTGLANRRAFDEALEIECRRARRETSPLSLLLLDVDRFKYFNDTYGHLAGDACLQVMAATIAMAAKRPGDVAARYGGEEIALILPRTNSAGAAFVAGELCRQIEALSLPHERNVPWQVATISIGVCTINVRSGEEDVTGAWMIQSADTALYLAKSAGRNRYAVAPDPAPMKLLVG